MNLQSTPPVTQPTSVSKPIVTVNQLSEEQKIQPILSKLNEIEASILPYAGKIGYNPYIYIAEKINPIRTILKRGTKPSRLDEPKEITDERIKRFNEAIDEAATVSAALENVKVHTYTPPPDSTEVPHQVGDPVVLKPVE